MPATKANASSRPVQEKTFEMNLPLIGKGGLRIYVFGDYAAALKLRTKKKCDAYSRF
jgi:hypothetical protein